AGVRVAGGDARDTSRAAPRDTLVRWLSQPLAAVLPALEKPSQNQLAELFFRTLGLAFDSGGTERAAQRVVTAQLQRWGVDSTRAAVRDGSGLSRHDYVAPEAIVRVLEAMRQGPDSATFRSALPVAGVDGTLASRMKGTPAQGRLQAKTGTLDKARSLSGYLTTTGGATLLVSMLANNWTTSVGAVTKVQDLIAARLAALPLAPVDHADRR
ncbi:MAG: D-alanyl-D-alanine carboxypeptidase/D-alanyl-D-alanine-endopeptidase, partial [Gemmatimonadetes bacterium]|nr:D-alanyl-D-alanine carboxypeptidase/D-alanyl-D-alanine-endopeptidase [Gemmatimonadota bacterium]